MSEEDIDKFCIREEKKTYRISSAILIVSLFLFLFSYIVNLGSSEANIFFQRSGAILTLGGVVSEFILVNMRTLVIESLNKEEVIIESECATKLFLKYKLFSYASYTYIVLGTLIWGYGDIFY
ncbi:MAG: hypothetical protein GX118_04700 [Arcobacter butzleri]|nr:hypothetical protein [Aliarcobacter butzleri]